MKFMFTDRLLKLLNFIHTFPFLILVFNETSEAKENELI